MLVLAVAAPAFAQTTVTARWDRNTDSLTAGYRVFYGTAPSNYQWNFDAGNQTEATLSLSPGNLYYVVIRAYNGSYELGPPSNEATVDLRAPAPAPVPAPTASISATLQGTNTAAVSWNTTNAATVTINGQSVGASGSATVTISATTTFTIVATNSAGVTATQSATVTYTPPAPAPTPTPTPAPTPTPTPTPTPVPAPTAVIYASLRSAGTAQIDWVASNAVSARINGQAVALNGSTTVPISATTTFTLVATNSAGVTATKSATVTYTPPAPAPTPTPTPAPTPTPQPGAPSSPTIVAASVQGTRTTLVWKAPSTGNAQQYLLTVGSEPGAANIAKDLPVGNVLSVAGDLPKGRYYARVRAANAAGVSAYSNEAPFKVGRTLRTPGGFKVTWRGTKAVLTWVASAADSAEDMPSTYVLEAGTRPGSSDVAVVAVGNTTSFEVDVPSGTYFVRIKAVNDLGDSEPTQDVTVSAPGAPHAPQGLGYSNAGNSVHMWWGPPGSGDAPTGYVIEAGTAPGRSDLGTFNVGNVVRFTTTAPGGTYYVRVRAVNGRGAGAPSNEIVIQR